ncbi:hypothetical protein [Streptomyces sp. NPDC054765]
MNHRAAPPLRADAVVLDIEGTTGSASHVHDVLFPYARERFAGWFVRHRGTERQAAVLRQIRDADGRPDLDEAGAVRALLAWTDADIKAALLKAVQSLIWAEGYADGTLTGHVYDDVPPALERWAGGTSPATSTPPVPATPSGTGSPTPPTGTSPGSSTTTSSWRTPAASTTRRPTGR